MTNLEYMESLVGSKLETILIEVRSKYHHFSMEKYDGDVSLCVYVWEENGDCYRFTFDDTEEFSTGFELFRKAK